jgi:hypothetical protein
MTGLFIRELLMFEAKIVEKIKDQKLINMFRCVRVKGLEISNHDELLPEIEKVMMDGKTREISLVKDCHMIEEHFEEFFNFNILYKVMKKANLPKLVQ